MAPLCLGLTDALLYVPWVTTLSCSVKVSEIFPVLAAQTLVNKTLPTKEWQLSPNRPFYCKLQITVHTDNAVLKTFNPLQLYCID